MRDSGIVFDKSAHWYDLFYAHKDYALEAAEVVRIAREVNPSATSLLDVACGTGRHLECLAPAFDRVAGVDLDPALAAIARARLGPAVTVHVADMIELALPSRFDVITCLFSSIGYANTVSQLHRTIAAFGRHLNPGGVLIVEPWILKEWWIEPGVTQATVLEQAEGKLVRVGTTKRSGTTTQLLLHYVHAHDGTIECFDETHDLGLYTKDEYLGAVSDANLTPSWLGPGFGRGLLMGIRPHVN